METFGRMLLSGFVGAISACFGLLILGLAGDYFTNHNIRTFAPIMGAILGFLVGGLVGGFIGLIQPKIRTALIFVTIVAIILLIFDAYSFFTSSDFQYFIEQQNYRRIFIEIILSVVFDLMLVLVIFLITRTVSVSKKQSLS